MLVALEPTEEKNGDDTTEVSVLSPSSEGALVKLLFHALNDRGWDVES